MVYFEKQKFLILKKFNLSFFVLACAFGAITKKALSHPKFKKIYFKVVFWDVYSFNTYMYVWFIFSLCVCVLEVWFLLPFFSTLIVHYPNTICWKDYFPPPPLIECFEHPNQKLTTNVRAYLEIFSSIPLLYIF